MAKNIDYKEIAKAKVQEKRNVVISECSKGGFTIAQQLEVHEGNHCTNVYLKGAFHVDDRQGLMNLRDAINVVLEKTKKS